MSDVYEIWYVFYYMEFGISQLESRIFGSGSYTSGGNNE